MSKIKENEISKDLIGTKLLLSDILEDGTLILTYDINRKVYIVEEQIYCEVKEIKEGRRIDIRGIEGPSNDMKEDFRK